MNIKFKMLRNSKMILPDTNYIAGLIFITVLHISLISEMIYDLTFCRRIRFLSIFGRLSPFGIISLYESPSGSSICTLTNGWSIN